MTTTTRSPEGLLIVQTVAAVAPDRCEPCGRDVVPVLVHREVCGVRVATDLGWTEPVPDGDAGYRAGVAHTPNRCRSLRYGGPS